MRFHRHDRGKWNAAEKHEPDHSRSPSSRWRFSARLRVRVAERARGARLGGIPRSRPSPTPRTRALISRRMRAGPGARPSGAGTTGSRGAILALRGLWTTSRRASTSTTTRERGSLAPSTLAARISLRGTPASRSSGRSWARSRRSRRCRTLRERLDSYVAPVCPSSSASSLRLMPERRLIPSLRKSS